MQPSDLHKLASEAMREADGMARAPYGEFAAMREDRDRLAQRVEKLETALRQIDEHATTAHALRVAIGRKDGAAATLARRVSQRARAVLAASSPATRRPAMTPSEHAAKVLHALSWEAVDPDPSSWGGARAEARDAVAALVAQAERAGERTPISEREWKEFPA